MGVTFVLGRAGVGKTKRCIDSIVAAAQQRPLGPALLWITPRQSTFAAERDLTCGSGLRGICRARVLSFHRLAQEVRSLGGGDALPMVTPLGRQMVIGHLLRRHQGELRFFRSSARQIGLAAELDATFAEMEHAGKGAAEVASVIADLRGDAAPSPDLVPLLDKLHDVHLLYDAYCTFLGQQRLDPHRRLQQVISTMASCSLFHDAVAYVDGFARFSQNERRMLVALAQACRSVEVMLLLDPASPVVHQPELLPADHSLFHETETTYRQLWFAFHEAGVAMSEPILLEKPRRFTSPALRHLERNLFENGVPFSGAAAEVELVEAPDRRGEADAAARAVNRLLREGLRLRDIAVLVRDLDAYHKLLDSSFAAHGICYFVDRRRTAAHHPLLQMVRAALQIARFDWPPDAAMTLLKSGLAGVRPAEADALENYALEHRIRGAAGWERAQVWNFRRRAEEDSAAGETDQTAPQDRGLDVLRRAIIAALAPLLALASMHSPKPSVRLIANAIFAMLRSFGVARQLAAWAAEARDAGRLEEAAEHEQVWAAMVDLFEELVDLLGDEPLALGEFADVLEAGLEKFDLALTPPTVDQVLVGQIDRTRCPPVRAAVLLGLSQGQFPRAATDDSILSDADRRELRRRRVDLEPDTTRQRLNEQLLGYIAFTRASEQLIVCRPASAAAGRSAEPSPFWHDLRAVLPAAAYTRIEPLPQHPAHLISTGRQLVVALMQQARAGDLADAPNQPWPALYHWLANEGRLQKSIARPLEQAWGALRYDNAARLSAEIGHALFPAPLEAGVRQLETFAACPFQHFARYGLRLAERHNAQVSALDLSHVYRDVLQTLTHEALRRRADWTQLSQSISTQEMSQFVQQAGQTLRDELMLSSARNRYLLLRIEMTLEQVLAAQSESLRRGEFEPTLGGLAYGPQRRIGPLKIATPSGSSAELRGRIDRIDLTPDGSAKAIDYKLGVGHVAWAEVYYGLSLRLLTHLLVLQANGQQLAGRPLTPAAALYVQLSRTLDSVAHPDEAVDPASEDFQLRIKPRGLFSESGLPLLDADPEMKISKVVHGGWTEKGQLRKQGDALPASDFTAVLAFVERRLGELADGILSAQIDVKPYYLKGVTPCPQCPYRAVCRFETSINSYRSLAPLKRDEAIARMGHAGGGRHES